jgi:hypothetical protein
VVVLGLAHSAAMVAGAAALLVLLGRRARQVLPIGASLLRSLLCAAAAYGAARAVADVLPSASRASAAFTVVVAGALGIAVYAGLQWAARAPEFRGVGAGAAP